MKYLALGFRLLRQIQSIGAVERSSSELLPGALVGAQLALALQRSGRLRDQQKFREMMETIENAFYSYLFTLKWHTSADGLEGLRGQPQIG